MRTKTLLVAAAISAVGLTASLAQSVYSVNVVGYVNAPVVVGYNLLANPLDATPDNNLNSVIPATTDGAGLLKWDNVSQGFMTPQTYVDGLGWCDPDLNPTTFTISPGEGFFFNAPAVTNITFVGDVKQGALSATMLTGYNLLSSLTPQTGDLGDVAFAFPAADGDGLLFWDKVAQSWSAPLTYVDGLGWCDADLNPQPAVVQVGQGFFVNKTGGATWNLTFNVN
jgi:hypothetical protein